MINNKILNPYRSSELKGVSQTCKLWLIWSHLAHKIYLAMSLKYCKPNVGQQK